MPKYSVKGAAPTPVELNQLVALFNAGRHAELESRARLLLERYPDSGFAWKVLGASLEMQGKGGLFALQKAAELLPGDADAHSNLGNAQLAGEAREEAISSFRRALELKPDFAEAHNNLGNALKSLGRLDDAVASYRHALVIKPGYAEAHNNLGLALQASVLFEEAVASYRRALEIKPDYAEVHSNLGISLRAIGQFESAISSCRRALEIKPDFAEAHSNLGNALQDLGQLDHAVTSYRRALEIKPNDHNTYFKLFYALSSIATDASGLFAEYCRFGELFEVPLRASWPQHTNSRDPQRCLRIGFVSGDLRNHALANFFEPVLAHLADYPQLSLYAYCNNTIKDSVTQRLLGHMPRWWVVVDLPDADLAEKIRADGIDILIDLSGITDKNRLLTFARKPAPVQASWMGFPGTTGLSAMDYYLADRLFLPPGQFDDQFTEKIVHLPAGAAFLPNKDAPPVNALPALSNGYVTFGSFNRPTKISRPVIALWSQLLRALPDSRMVLGAMLQVGENGTLIEWFAQEGIARERMDFHPRSGMDVYLALHQQVDICLDTFPYNGGTTTFHALWMGVPTLSLAGSTPAARSGAAILGHAGLDAFIAHDAADFVQKGLYWAGNLAALSDIRAGLREHFAQSAMGQPAVVAAGVERALRIMWQRWCEGLPPETFFLEDYAGATL